MPHFRWPLIGPKEGAVSGAIDVHVQARADDPWRDGARPHRALGPAGLRGDRLILMITLTARAGDGAGPTGRHFGKNGDER